MPTVPTKANEKIEFFEARLPGFTTNATAIGLVSGDCTALDTKTDAARAAYNAHVAAQMAAKTATEAMYDTLEAMGAAGAAVIKKIRAKAEQTGDPAVYTLANIPAPATPAPRPAPGTPAALKAVLNQDGSMDLAWKCANHGAAGTLYPVYRRDTPAGEFKYLGGSGQRKYLDATIPAGTTEVTYMIQGVRTTIAGPWGLFTVTCGAGAGGATTVTQSAAPASPKLAA